MDLTDKQVQNEGICLLRLCKELKDFIRLGLFRKTYLRETEDFVKLITQSLDAVEAFVSNTIDKPIVVPPLLKAKLKEFDTIKIALNWLYVFTKEVVDADTLSTPYSLTISLNYLAKKFQKSLLASLVILGSSDLMYYKYNLKDLRELTGHLSKIIPSYPTLGENIGVLKFPYCASQEILVNCNLFHEMGHYIYENTELPDRFYTNVEKNFDEFTNRNPKIIQATLFPLYGRKFLLNNAREFLLNWADEIFADIFAIKILGPAFHLAFLEMNKILPDMPPGIAEKFSLNHPADFYRFKIHAKWLFKDGWSDIIQERTPWVHEQLQKCERLEVKNGDFHINYKSPIQKEKDKDGQLEKSLHGWILEEFEKIVAIIEGDIVDRMKGYENPINDFNTYDNFVSNYLEHGVVPSTIYNAAKQECHPNPTTMLNSGFFFYLGGMKSLLKIIENKDSDIVKRINYEKRLNDWIAKGIEDWHILQRKSEQ